MGWRPSNSYRIVPWKVCDHEMLTTFKVLWKIAWILQRVRDCKYLIRTKRTHEFLVWKRNSEKRREKQMLVGRTILQLQRSLQIFRGQALKRREALLKAIEKLERIEERNRHQSFNAWNAKTLRSTWDCKEERGHPNKDERHFRERRSERLHEVHRPALFNRRRANNSSVAWI